MHTEGSIEIDCPRDDVFRLTNEHVAQWSEIVKEEETLTKTPNGVGSTFRTVTEERGRPMEFQGVVTAYEPPVRSKIQLMGEMFDLEVEYLFEDLGGRTRVTQVSDVHGKGIFGWILRLFGWAMKKSSCQALDKELQGLRRYCQQHGASTDDAK